MQDDVNGVFGDVKKKKKKGSGEPICSDSSSSSTQFSFETAKGHLGPASNQ